MDGEDYRFRVAKDVAQVSFFVGVGGFGRAREIFGLGDRGGNPAEVWLSCDSGFDGIVCILNLAL